MKYYLFFLFVMCTRFSFAQPYSTNASAIDATLKENANACVRWNKQEIQIKSQRQMMIKKHKVVTVFNERGHEYFSWGESYDPNRKINKVEVTIYNAAGGVDKKFKRKDFRDFSDSDGFSIANDVRNLVLDFTPTSYPYTIEYVSEIVTANTAFLPVWFPQANYFTSFENLNFEITFPEDLGFRYKLVNFDTFSNNIAITKTSLKFEAKNITAIKREELMPNTLEVFPHIRMALTKFHLVGVDGQASTWEELGTWMNEKLLAGTDELSDATKMQIKKEVEGITDPIEKVKKVYQFVQNKTRYVSIQLGIGGWKPMPAKDVDRLGYGDCKALTNYTRALLKEVGIDAYYTVIYLDNDIENIQRDFVSMQGNHAILAIPYKNEFIWAECTSQTNPLNYQAFSTDNRTALVVTPTGGKIIETNMYVNDDNLKHTIAHIKLTPEGNISAQVQIQTSGNQMNRRLSLMRAEEKKKKEFYTKRFNAANGVRISKMNIEFDESNMFVKETLDLTSQNVITKAGKRIMLTPNWFTDMLSVPSKNRDRKYPLYIDRGYTDEESIQITLPKGYKVEAIPAAVSETSIFGNYSMEYRVEGDNLIVHRKIQMKAGTHPKEQFEAYRLFVEKIVRNDNSKVVLIEL